MRKLHPAAPEVEPRTAQDTFITIVRRFPAPVSEVFAAWTDATLMRQWLAPIFCKIVELTADPQPGGRYKLVLKGPLGGTHVTSGEYREIVPNKRIVKTWVAEGTNPAVDRYETLVAVDFREVGPGATEVVLRQDMLRTKADQSGNRMGWRMCLNKLEKVLKRSGS